MKIDQTIHRKQLSKWPTRSRTRRQRAGGLFLPRNRNTVLDRGAEKFRRPHGSQGVQSSAHWNRLREPNLILLVCPRERPQGTYMSSILETNYKTLLEQGPLVLAYRRESLRVVRYLLKCWTSQQFSCYMRISAEPIRKEIRLSWTIPEYMG